MKSIFTFSVFLCFILFNPLKTFSQLEDNNWVFGKHEGLNFSNGTPTSILRTEIYQSEGCSSISDGAGNLLFYTDGINVWDKRNIVMPNGIGLTGDPSSTTSAYIVKKPQSDSLYYIFTTGEQGGQLGPSGGLRYSIVNIKANDGWGDVTEKNILLEQKVSEKIAAVKHANNRDIWLISEQFEYGFDSSKTGCVAFLITPNGIDTSTKVVSPAGFRIRVDALGENAIGQMKASPNGKRIAENFSLENFTLLYDFNNSTGAATNPIKIPGLCTDCVTDGYVDGGVYGLEFSPNGKLLYTSSNGTTSNSPYDSLDHKRFITQYKIDFSSETAIINSKKIVLNYHDTDAFHLPHQIGQMQLAPDGKIYVAEYGFSFLAAIDYPDIFGKGCSAHYAALFLTSSNPSDIPGCLFGLPAMFKDRSVVLPVTLSQFSGNLKDKAVLLTWQTATETNLNRFEIERSSNGTDFIKIGSVNSKGNSGITQQYSFTDAYPLTGTNYYRLKAVDMDGKITYSKIILIDVNETLHIVIYPNPVKKVLSIKGLNANSKTELTILDMQGHILLSTNTLSSVYSWNVQQLAAGTYVLRCEVDNNVTMMKFIKD